MRIFLLIFFIGMNSVFAETYSQEARLSLRLKNVSIEEFFAEIEKNSEYIFFYKENVLEETSITIDVKGKTLPQILDNVLVSRNISYYINDRQVLVTRNTTAEEEIVTPSTAQQTKKTITGLVTDTNGEPLAGATVVEKGTTNGIVVDAEGKFSLTVSENATLQVSFIGYIAQEITVGNQTNLKIALKEDTQALEEVIVVGYGTRVKGALTGSIAKTDSKIFETRPIVDAVNALQGAMPGVTVIRGST
ncbi:MAG: carboxypeptidase-like regulatory domain-containing protein, partial [Tannerella sp.]|nr:carboxypeptidase-like regulatory domain-containing protein [Tannerella sp.]